MKEIDYSDPWANTHSAADYKQNSRDIFDLLGDEDGMEAKLSTLKLEVLCSTASSMWHPLGIETAIFYHQSSIFDSNRPLPGTPPTSDFFLLCHVRAPGPLSMSVPLNFVARSAADVHTTFVSRSGVWAADVRTTSTAISITRLSPGPPPTFVPRSSRQVRRRRPVPDLPCDSS